MKPETFRDLIPQKTYVVLQGQYISIPSLYYGTQSSYLATEQNFGPVSKFLTNSGKYCYHAGTEFAVLTNSSNL